MMTTSPISLYAELLPNIRQISLALTLTLQEGGGELSSISIKHGDDSTGFSSLHLLYKEKQLDLPLPGRVACRSGHTLRAGGLFTPGEVLTWRLQLADDNNPADREIDSGRENGPWEARELVPGGGVSCRKCGASLIPKETVKMWKDLPAEGWAEMMEFWHCHKPGEEDHHHQGHSEQLNRGVEEQKDLHGKADESSLASRGYGADSTIVAQKGVGFVDLTTFLFSEDDCHGIVVSLLYLRAMVQVRKGMKKVAEPEP